MQSSKIPFNSSLEPITLHQAGQKLQAIQASSFQTSRKPGLETNSTNSNKTLNIPVKINSYIEFDLKSSIIENVPDYQMFLIA